MVKVAINGFGRIGRLAFRIGLLKHSNDIQFVAINTSGSMDVEGWAHLVNQDTTYRKFEIEVKWEKVRDAKSATDEDPLIGYLVIDSMTTKIPVLAQRDPEKIPWINYGVDIVMECTGRFASEEGALKHAKAGAKRVIISAPVKGGNVATFVLGTNGREDMPSVISNASCTTNCVAPVAQVMVTKFGVKKATLTTVHAYTDEQELQDGSHHDLRRARAAAMNVVPTSTGAAIATTETIPELKGLFDGAALRVPVITGSLTDFVFVTSRPVTREEVNQAFVEASGTTHKGIIGVSGINGTPKYLVSSDVIGTTYSAIVDPDLTQVIDGDLVKVMVWYDNEWGYATRLVEQTINLGRS